MKQTNLKDYTLPELLAKYKKAKKSQIINGFLIGALLGIAAFSTYKNGLGFFTFFPLFFVYVLMRKPSDLKNIEREIKNRQQ